MTPVQIRQIRLRLGLTLAEMASMLGYQGENLRQQMHDLETGRRPVREPQRRLAEAYWDGLSEHEKALFRLLQRTHRELGKNVQMFSTNWMMPKKEI